MDTKAIILQALFAYKEMLLVKQHEVTMECIKIGSGPHTTIYEGIVRPYGASVEKTNAAIAWVEAEL